MKISKFLAKAALIAAFVVPVLHSETLFQVKDSQDRVVLDVSTDGLRVYNEGDLLMEISSSDIRAFIDNDPQKGLARSFSVTTSSNQKGDTNVLEVTTQDAKMREGTDGDQYTVFSPENIFLGLNAGVSNTDGTSNVFLGNNSGFSNSLGGNNIFIGTESGHNSTNTFQNTFVGHRSGYSLTGASSTVVGSFAGENAGGSNNTFVGRSSGRDATGGNNTFFGQGSGASVGRINTGRFNTYIGENSGSFTTSGNNNVALGYWAGYLNLEGENNVMIGYHSGRGSGQYSGSNNIYIGYESGRNSNSATGNVFIGYQAGREETLSNKLYIANSSTSTPLIKGTFPNTDLEFRATNINLIGKVNATVLGSGSGANLHITSGNEIVKQTSSRKYKKDIEELFFDISKFMKLRPVSFKWNEKSSTENKEDYGLIAEEVEKIDPQLAIYDGEGDIEGVDYQKVNIMLLKVVQDQQNKIDELEKQNNMIIRELSLIKQSLKLE